ncbi:MAG TPA: BamA/TamA family outer membrane protein [Labilithrix sp.]|nr:BamA/TamA family outer membrane protein [Labilithrix sp.]
MRRGSFVCLLLTCFFCAAPASAQKPVSQTTEYSAYERESIAAALAKEGRKIDRAPEGKTIAKIEFVRLDVLEARDPGLENLRKVPILSIARHVDKPTLNSLHALSKEYIIRRELLLLEGERYVQVLMDEVARNMRDRMPFQVSLVVIVPVQSNEPDKVDLIVITKDIWSLRLSFDLGVTPGGLENLIIVPQETNFLGLHHTAQTRFQMQPETLTFGLGYKIPRFGYSWIGAGTSASITMNRDRGEPEGSAMALSVGQPLYSTRTKWAWDASIGYAVGVSRRYSNAQVFMFDSRRTRERDNIPFQYKSGSFDASAGVTRSFGWGLKNNVSLTMNASSANYETFDLSGFDPAAVADFRRRALPTGETRVYPALGWAMFTTNFLRTLDIATLALQEDYRLGPSVSASVYPVTRALGSSRDFIGVSGSAGYNVAVGDGIVRASVGASAEDQDGTISDGSVRGSFGAVTPRIFGLGRIVLNTSLTNRYRNYLNSRTFIGGEDRLRGYPTAFFFGKDTVFFNIEYRSRSIEILKAQLGGVLFFDAADAFDGGDATRGDVLDGFHAVRAKQSVGLGVRALFPQVNRNVLRLDVAFPIKRGPFPETGTSQIVAPVGFYFAFDQAFGP